MEWLRCPPALLAWKNEGDRSDRRGSRGFLLQSLCEERGTDSNNEIIVRLDWAGVGSDSEMSPLVPNWASKASRSL